MKAQLLGPRTRLLYLRIRLCAAYIRTMWQGTDLPGDVTHFADDLDAGLDRPSHGDDPGPDLTSLAGHFEHVIKSLMDTKFPDVLKEGRFENSFLSTRVRRISLN